MPSLKLNQHKESEFTAYHQASSPFHEIDLLDLLDVLWRAKTRILSTVFLFVIVALLISFLLPERWTSNAVITPAESIQWRTLENELAQLRALDVDIELKQEEVFSLFIKKFNSLTLLESYLQSSPDIMNALNGAESESGDLHQAIVAVSERMKAVNNDEKKKVGEPLFASWTLSFTAPEAHEAQSILAGYIQYISDLVVNDTLDDVRLKLDVKTRFEQEKLIQEEIKIKNQREANINRLNYALEIANAAGIKKPVYSHGLAVKDDPDYAISLGADGIAKKLQIEKSVTDPAQMNAELRDHQFRVKQLEALKIEELAFRPFRYQLQPSLPVQKEGPGKALILVLAGLLGGILACGGVLLRHAMASRQKATQQTLPASSL